MPTDSQSAWFGLEENGPGAHSTPGLRQRLRNSTCNLHMAGCYRINPSRSTDPNPVLDRSSLVWLTYVVEVGEVQMGLDRSYASKDNQVMRFVDCPCAQDLTMRPWAERKKTKLWTNTVRHFRGGG